MRILAVNAGSTSLKVSVIGDADETVHQSAAGAAPADASAAVDRVLADVGEVDAVCHRIVHGGRFLHEAVVVDDSVRAQLDDAALLAPLHDPAALRILDSLRARLPVPAVACFDTSFHARMPDAASTYAVPAAWREAGVRRYGFHGLSCAWSLRQAATLLQRDASSLHIIVAHLGGGCSVTAVRDGHGVDTTMGFSPLEGLVMATRSGSIDAAAVLWLQQQRGLSATELGTALERQSGVLALSGSNDMSETLRRCESGDAAACVAVDVFVHRLRSAIGGAAMSLERVDCIVFTGGIGENAAVIRERAVTGFAPSGVVPPVLTVHAREDLQMAAETRRLLS